MRISTITMYEQSLNSLNRQQSEFLKVGLQMASGKRVANPSDDPQAASLAVGVVQAKAIDEQYTNARVSVRNSLSQEESILNTTSDSIVRARTLLIQARNESLPDESRTAIAQELEGIYQGLLGQANATDSSGRYLFGGYQDGTPPFVEGADGRISYVGDDNVRSLKIDSARSMPTGDNGRTVFASSDDADLFGSLKDMIDVLSTPVTDDASRANLRDTLTTAGAELDKSFDNVLGVRALLGARLNELDAIDVVSGNRDLNYDRVLSDRLDLDYNAAVSEYSLRQVGLQAAQQAFMTVQKLSLFNQM